MPLHRLTKGEITSFKDTFLETLGRSSLLVEDIDKRGITEDRHIRVYLDGLDEIASPTRRQEVVELARKGMEENPHYQIILTARDHINGSWLTWLPRVSLSGLDKVEIGSLINKWLGEGSEETRRFHEQLHRAPTLANLMRTPLLATLIILVFRQTGRLPESKTKLYEIFIDLLSGGWDMSKGIIRETKFGQRIKKLILTTLAGKIHQNGLREFGNKEIKAVVKATISQALSYDWELLRDELIEDGLIVRAGDTLQFPHLSFQEFLAAKDLMGDPQLKQLRRALVAFLYGDDWWREVLRFYVGLSSKPREITLWLIKEVDRISDNLRATDNYRVDDLLAGVVESFPEFPIEDLVGHMPKSRSV